MMRRRQFIQSLALAAGSGLLSGPFNKLYAAPADYEGRLLLVLQAEGGWDVTSLCDPKTNTPGELEINQWARTADIETAGNIAYAPFANNAELFGKYHRYMLVINGVDAQTNSQPSSFIPLHKDSTGAAGTRPAIPR